MRRALDADLGRAGVPRCAPRGKLDFHACRVAYVTFVLETGASAKEGQDLALHSATGLTRNTCALSRLCN